VNLAKEDSFGPRVMVCGPVDTGKSSLCRILLNYATRLKRSVLFVDLDVGQGEISIPGTMSLAALSTPIDVEEGFNLISPLVFFYGHTSPDKNVSHYKIIVDHITNIIEQKVIFHFFILTFCSANKIQNFVKEVLSSIHVVGLTELVMIYFYM
jgi:polyribonucleotide 5'-hydroxyl-kinase